MPSTAEVKFSLESENKKWLDKGFHIGGDERVTLKIITGNNSMCMCMC